MLKSERQYKRVTTAVIAAVLVLFALAWYFGPGQAAVRGDASAEAVVESFGSTLKNVSLTADTAALKTAIEEQYAPYVTPELLAAWLADPKSAPGRLTSSPSPDRIGVATVDTQGDSRIVSGEVIYVTSADTLGEPADTAPFVALVTPTENGWKIAAYQEEEVQTLKKLPTTDEDIPGAR